MATETAHKACRECRRELPCTEQFFYPDHVRHDGTVAFRGRCRDCYKARQRVLSRLARTGERPKPKGKHGGGRLPVGPFRDWVLREARQLQVAHPNKCGGVLELSRVIGVSERSLTRVIHGAQQFVSLNVVDSALCRRGCHLIELYPELYADD